MGADVMWSSKSRKRCLAVAMGAGLSVALTGCGGGDGGTQTETLSTPVPTTAEPSFATTPDVTPTSTIEQQLTWEQVMDQVKSGIVRVSAGACGSASSLGSGFFIDDRHVVTAAHVVDGASGVSIEIDDVGLFSATILAADPAFDVALLRTEQGTAPAGLPLATEEPKQASELAVIGYPLGALTSQIVNGIVSGESEPIDYGTQVVESVFTTNASTNPGNSGGPVLNRRGEVIGLVSGGVEWDLSSDDPRPVEGINYVVPSTAFSPLIEEWAFTPTRVAPTCEGDESTKPDEEVSEDDGDLLAEGFPVDVLSEHRLASEFAIVLHTHGTAINQAQYGLAWSYFTPEQHERLGGLDDWSRDVAPSYWEHLLVTDVAETSDTSATVSTRLRTEDALESGWTCTVFTLDYEFVRDGHTWLIDRARSQADPEACEPTRG